MRGKIAGPSEGTENQTAARVDGYVAAPQRRRGHSGGRKTSGSGRKLWRMLEDSRPTRRSARASGSGGAVVSAFYRGRRSGLRFRRYAPGRVTTMPSVFLPK